MHESSGWIAFWMIGKYEYMKGTIIHFDKLLSEIRINITIWMDFQCWMSNVDVGTYWNYEGTIDHRAMDERPNWANDDKGEDSQSGYFSFNENVFFY